MWKSVVKIVFIMTPIEMTNLVVVVLVDVILKARFQNDKRGKKSNCDRLNEIL